ncbi:MAG: hypothetical protein LZ174_08420, partial [Thaumarchaeota archaeon]|nr:hypothetical protein [Candidatus Geocrenenecus arthurdayi]
MEEAVFRDHLHYPGDGLRVVWGSMTPGPQTGAETRGYKPGPPEEPMKAYARGLCPVNTLRLRSTHLLLGGA